MEMQMFRVTGPLSDQVAELESLWPEDLRDSRECASTVWRYSFNPAEFRFAGRLRAQWRVWRDTVDLVRVYEKAVARMDGAVNITIAYDNDPTTRVSDEGYPQLLVCIGLCGTVADLITFLREVSAELE